MANSIKIKVNGLTHGVSASLETPLLYVLHNELHLHGPRFGCGLAQCGACSVLLDGKEIRSCVTPVAANMDSLAFRLQNMNTDLDGSRWAAVLQAAATAAGWKPWVSGSNLSKENVVTGRGIANSHHGGAYAATVADIQVNKKTGKITILHLYSSQDSGFAMNPDLIYNQMLGNMIQGASRLLSEEVTFNKNQVTSIDWIGYPILRFKDSPQVTLSLVQRTDQPSLGSGEPPTCSVIGAIANAFYDATGVRLHEAPFTPGRVRATLKAAGVI